MNPLYSLRNLFKKSTQVPPEGQQWLEGVHAFEKGKIHFRDKDQQKALDCFDRAIKSGYEGEGVYGLRAICLQEFHYELDAIDDFNKAISLAPEEANLYFMRSLSRSATGDYTGCISDLQEAIRLSKIDNKYNDFWNNYAKETGWTSATAHYEMDLMSAQQFRKGVEKVKELEEKHPELGIRHTKKDSARWRRV